VTCDRVLGVTSREDPFEHLDPRRVLQRGGLAPTIGTRACEYMISTLTEDVSLSEVAAIANLSLAHFSSSFKRSIDVSPHAWFRRQRVDLEIQPPAAQAGSPYAMSAFQKSIIAKERPQWAQSGRRGSGDRPSRR
jgi:hypothetical protein